MSSRSSSWSSVGAPSGARAKAARWKSQGADQRWTTEPKPRTDSRRQKNYDAPPPGGRFDVTVVLTPGSGPAETRSTPVSDRPARSVARVRAVQARLRDLRRAGCSYRRRRPADSVRLHPMVEAAGFRPAQRAHFGLVALPAAPQQLADHRGCRSRNCDCK